VSRFGEEPAPAWATPPRPAPPPGAAPPVPAQPAAAVEPLPRFGEYVYVEELPEAVLKVPPAYPEFARANGVEGTVLVQALVGKDGWVKDTRVVAPIAELNDAAVECVKRWHFKPAMSKGQPVAVWVAIPIKFSLR
jgi:protein TonB